MKADAEPAAPTVRVRAWASGRVQGVGYRAFVRSAAIRLSLHGGVRNLEDGRVEVEAEGPRPALEALLEQLRLGPPGAKVEDLQVRWESASGRFVGFRIW